MDSEVKCWSGLVFPFQINLYAYAHVRAEPPRWRGEVRERRGGGNKTDGPNQMSKGGAAQIIQPCHRSSWKWLEGGLGGVGWGGLSRIEALAHWQTAAPCSASSLLSFLTSFDIFNYVFHTWLTFFFYSTPTSSPPPSPPPTTVLPASFLFFAAPFLQLYSISSLSGCTLIALCVWNGRGQVAQGSYYSRAHVADGVSRGRPGWTETEGRGGRGSGAAAERRGCCQICQRRGFQFTRRGRRGSSRAKRSEMGGLVFLDGYILSTCHPPENNRGSGGVGSSTGAFVFWGEIWWMKVSWNEIAFQLTSTAGSTSWHSHGEAV